MKKIDSFTINHDVLVPGIFVSRIDGDITTYDLRTRKPNSGDLMSNAAMHSLEHMFATIIRNSPIADSIIYFGPMGCQTGFYLLIRNADHKQVLTVILDVLNQILAFEGDVFGNTSIECGNYRNLSLGAAKEEGAKFLAVLEQISETSFTYPEA